MDTEMLSDFLTQIIAIALAALILVGSICIIFCVAQKANYHLDKSLCSLYIDGNNVYSDRCHFLSIQSIGENGNTKEVIIYKDSIKLQPLKRYVSNNVYIEEVKNVDNN